MAQNRIRLRRLKDIVIRWRWAIALFAAIALTAFEIYEHRSHVPMIFQDRAFILEVFVYGITFPLFFGTLLSLYHTREQLTEAQQRIVAKKTIERQFIQARDWDELVMYVLQVPRLCLPLKGSVLLVQNKKSKEYEIVGQWRAEGVSLPIPTAAPFSPSCHWTGKEMREGATDLVNCPCFDHSTASEALMSFCYPLIHGMETVGIMYFFISKADSPDPIRLEFLADISIVMALGIETYRLRQGFEEEESAAEAERLRISRYLHDTLVPNLAYLRLKLDQLYLDGTVVPTNRMQEEVRWTSDIAAQSYEFVRDVLSELREATQIDLVNGIKESATMIGGRANFHTEIIQKGEPMMISTQTTRQALLIVREALHNVEKHARATQVTVEICWQPEQLIIDVTDNGVGSLAQAAETNGLHFGLKIIEETLQELNGRFTIDATPGNGTKFTSWIPITSKVIQI
ncbi:MAG: hypothetical protein EHM70_19760 [Chloroflexota bacterium]|nr:MAG: hypothetical protein EHM70_19760 [Chloroflexota bacterium]